MNTKKYIMVDYVHKVASTFDLNFSAISHLILNMSAFEGKTFTRKKNEEVHKMTFHFLHKQTLDPLRNKRGERENGSNFFDCTSG